MKTSHRFQPLHRPTTILILSFAIVTGFLIRENWDLAEVKVTELLETTRPSESVESVTITRTTPAPTGEPVETDIVDPVFEAFLDEISERLPTKEQFQYLSAREAHGHPRLLLETAYDFGQLAERMQDNVSLRPKGLEFYKGCALNSQLVTSVRAVCFHHAQVLEIDLYARIWEFKPEQIPSSVIELAKTL